MSEHEEFQEPEGAEEILTVAYDLNGRKVTGDLYTEFGYRNVRDVENPYVTMEIMHRASQLLPYWSLAGNAAQELVLERTLERDLWYADVSSACARDILAEYGKSGCSDAAIRREVIRRYSEEFFRHEQAINHAKTIHANCRVIADALEKRISVQQSTAKIQESLLLKSGVGTMSEAAEARKKVSRWSRDE